MVANDSEFGTATELEGGHGGWKVRSTKLSHVELRPSTSLPELSFQETRIHPYKDTHCPPGIVLVLHSFPRTIKGRWDEPLSAPILLSWGSLEASSVGSGDVFHAEIPKQLYSPDQCSWECSGYALNSKVQFESPRPLGQAH